MCIALLGPGDIMLGHGEQAPLGSIGQRERPEGRTSSRHGATSVVCIVLSRARGLSSSSSSSCHFTPLPAISKAKRKPPHSSAPSTTSPSSLSGTGICEIVATRTHKLAVDSSLTEARIFSKDSHSCTRAKPPTNLQVT